MGLPQPNDLSKTQNIIASNYEPIIKSREVSPGYKKSNLNKTLDASKV